MAMNYEKLHQIAKKNGIEEVKDCNYNRYK